MSTNSPGTQQEPAAAPREAEFEQFLAELMTEEGGVPAREDLAFFLGFIMGSKGPSAGTA